MKTLAFITIAVTIGFASISLAQTCGLFEPEANIPNSYTWTVLVNAIIENNPNPDHWEDKEADYYINTGSCPLGAEDVNAEIVFYDKGRVKMLRLRWANEAAGGTRHPPTFRRTHLPRFIPLQHFDQL